MNQFEHATRLFIAMRDIAWRMPDEIYLNHWDQKPIERRYVLATFADAYKTIELFCEGMKTAAIIQCGMLLRLLLEQTAIVGTLVSHPELLPNYIKHFKLRLSINGLSKTEQIKRIKKEFSFDEKKISPLQFLDYGWLGNGIEKEPNKQNALIKRAGFNDCISWKKQILDKFAHQSMNFVNVADKDNGSKLTIPFAEISGKLTDHLSCAFHAFTGFEFVWDKVNLFQDIFRPLFASFDPKENRL